MGVAREALAICKTYCHPCPPPASAARPHWPLGLPGWRDGWLALALGTADGTTLVAPWRRGAAPETVTVPLLWTADTDRPRLVSGAGPQPSYDWDGPERTVRVTLPVERSAVLLSFGAGPGGTRA